MVFACVSFFILCTDTFWFSLPVSQTLILTMYDKNEGLGVLFIVAPARR